MGVAVHITGHTLQRSLEPFVKDKFSHLALADPDFYIAAPVDLLLGAYLFSSIIDGRQVVVDKSLAAAFSSCFDPHWVSGALRNIGPGNQPSCPYSRPWSNWSIVFDTWRNLT